MTDHEFNWKMFEAMAKHRVSLEVDGTDRDDALLDLHERVMALESADQSRFPSVDERDRRVRVAAYMDRMTELEKSDRLPRMVTDRERLADLQSRVDEFVMQIRGPNGLYLHGGTWKGTEILAKLRELGIVRGDEDKRTCGSCSHFTVVHDQGDYSMGRCSRGKFGRSALAYDGHLPCDDWKARAEREQEG